MRETNLANLLASVFSALQVGEAANMTIVIEIGNVFHHDVYVKMFTRFRNNPNRWSYISARHNVSLAHAWLSTRITLAHVRAQRFFLFSFVFCFSLKPSAMFSFSSMAAVTVARCFIKVIKTRRQRKWIARVHVAIKSREIDFETWAWQSLSLSLSAIPTLTTQLFQNSRLPYTLFESQLKYIS